MKVAKPNAREPSGEVIHHGGRKDMSIGQAEDMGSFRVINQAERILSCPDIVSVVDGIGAANGIFIREDAIDLYDSEIFVYRIRSRVIGQSCASSNVWPVGLRPQREVRQNRRVKVLDWLIDPVRVRQESLPRLLVRHNGDFGQVPLLAEALVVSKNERLVLLNGSTRGTTELISPERRDARVIRPGLAVKEVPRIQGAVAQKFVCRTVEVIGTGLRHDGDVSTGPVAELSGVHVGHDVEFPHGLNT